MGPVGAMGPQGPSGAQSLLKIVTLPPGSPQCPAGGEEIDVGVDTNGDGTLEDSEVQQTSYVCNGNPNGPSGVGPCSEDAQCDDANVCTADFCAAGQCAHGMSPYGTLCRAANGACDQAEYCTGSSTVCPADTYAPSSFVCRRAADLCDAPEQCTGRSTVCPTDAYQAQGHECRGATSCGVASTCDGVSAACPDNAPVAQGTVCRYAYSSCDITEVCDGTSSECPADAIEPAGTSCTGVCGKSGTCTGNSTTCSVATTCSSGQTQPCSCGSIFTPKETCTGCGEWSACSASSAYVTLPWNDAGYSHDCGIAPGNGNPPGWTIYNTSTPYPSNCSPGQKVFDWSGTVPAGYYDVSLDAAGYSVPSLPDLTMQVFVNGALVSSNALSKNYNWPTFGTAQVSLSDCSTLRVVLVFDGGTSYDVAAVMELHAH